MGGGVALTRIHVDVLGAAAAAGFALMVMGWIQDDLDHRTH